MSIRFVFRCDGCEAKAEAGHVRRTFEAFNGKGYGFGTYRVIANPEDDAPEGWVAFDLIGCTYCPDCWKDIQSNALDERPDIYSLDADLKVLP